MDTSEEQLQNASEWISKSSDGVSNVTSDSDVHDLKQPGQRIVTPQGMRIDEREEQRQNASVLIS
jgi:hypothetical protein